MKIVVGLGNPGAEYEGTRHNTGKMISDMLEGKTEANIKFITPNTFMNDSGKAILPYIKSKKDLQNLLVIYDDIDLPLGRMKISYNRSSGGHKGLESIIKKLKSQEFTRIRIGITP